MSRDFVKAGLLALLGWLENAAQATATQVDDEAVDVGVAIIKEELLFDWFFGRLEANDDGTLSIEAGPPAELREVLERRKLDWAKVVEVATTLITLYRMFKG